MYFSLLKQNKKNIISGCISIDCSQTHPGPSFVKSGYLVQPAACGWKPGLLPSIWHILTLGWVLRTCSLEKEIVWSERRGGSDDEGLASGTVEGAGGAELGDHRGTEPAVAVLVFHSAPQAVSWATANHFQELGLCKEKPLIRCEGAIKYPSISSSISYSLGISKIIQNKPEEQINSWTQLNLCPRSDSYPLTVPESIISVDIACRSCPIPKLPQISTIPKSKILPGCSCACL